MAVQVQFRRSTSLIRTLPKLTFTKLQFQNLDKTSFKILTKLELRILASMTPSDISINIHMNNNISSNININRNVCIFKRQRHAIDTPWMTITARQAGQWSNMSLIKLYFLPDLSSMIQLPCRYACILASSAHDFQKYSANNGSGAQCRTLVRGVTGWSISVSDNRPLSARPNLPPIPTPPHPHHPHDFPPILQ